MQEVIVLAVIRGAAGLKEIWPGTAVQRDQEQQQSASFNHSNVVTQIQVDVLCVSVCV